MRENGEEFDYIIMIAEKGAEMIIADRKARQFSGRVIR
jgi:hypothetical protein